MKYLMIFAMMVGSVFGRYGRYAPVSDVEISNAISNGSNVSVVYPRNDAVDRSAEINTALTKYASTGGTVRLMDGTYYISGTITIPGDNITLEMSSGTIIRPITAHSFTLVDYRSNGTYYGTSLIYATGRTNVHVKGGQIDFGWDETELTITGVSGSDVTVAEDLSTILSNGDYVHTMELSDPALTDASKDATISNVSGTGPTTLTLSALATGLAANDKLMYGGPLNKANYNDITWSGVWLDNCTDSSVSDMYIDEVAYYVDFASGSGFSVSLTRCTDCVGRDLTGIKGGYECFGVRDGNTRTGFINCTAKEGRRHSGQIAAWFNGVASQENNTKCFMDYMRCDGRLIMHSGDNNDKNVECSFTNSKCTTFSMTGDLDRCSVANLECGESYITLMNDNGQTGTTVSGCKFYKDDTSSAYNAITMNCSGNTGAAESFSDIKIIGNSFTGCKIFINPSSASTMFDLDNYIISNNTFTSTHTSNNGINITIGFGTDCDITNGIIANNTYSNTSGDFVYLTQYDTDSAIKNLTLNNNTATCDYFTFVLGNSGQAGEVDNYIISNNVATCGSYFFRQNVACAVDGVVIKNNIIVDCSYAYTDDGSSMSNSVFDGNYIINWDSGLFLTNAPSVIGLNSSPDGFTNGTEQYLWRRAVNPADSDQVFTQQNQSGTWTTIDTIDASP